MTIVYLTGIIITFFLSSLLLTKKRKTGADYILAAWLFLLGLHLFLFYTVLTKRYLEWPFLLGLGIPLPLAHGPFLYLYTAALTNQFPPKNRWFWHFLPFLALYICLSGFLSLPGIHKIYVYEHEGRGYETETVYIFTAIILSGITYIFLSLLLLKKHRKRILEQYADTEKINLNWLRYLIAGIGIIWAIVIWGDEAAIYTVVVFFILFIGYFGIKQVGILNSPEETVLPPAAAQITGPDLLETPETAPTAIPKAANKKYQKSRLGPDALEKIQADLKQLMEKERLYTDPELTLSRLSERLQVHPNILSQVINTTGDQNFYDYINTLRVAAFLELLADSSNKKYTLLSLAFECGFNSKASFNRNFKKCMGITPTEYQKQVEHSNI
ncbi:helix-turn-helix domain-containing protein [Niabella pedocola]|uniref:Helix-turn-helix domain-containing protein n=1 Tax=Niabella pedocola TaxID=1752077 RepID=A0ABS8PUS5_9BACT|nr:helix-turn-helix domain-containing protein [Niabella pedocola]MCD2424820.1 helix-turn-helix domain-containing protein [Niabella pedocola]